MAKRTAPRPIPPTLHVLPAGEAWEVTRAGRDVALVVAESRDEAVRRAIDEAANRGCAAVVVHASDYAIDEVVRLDDAHAHQR